MAIRTDEDFEAMVDDDLSWRRIELLALAKELESAASRNSTSPISRALTRGMTTLLYAHWEGYCKAIFEEYVKLVIKRKPLLIEAVDSLIVAHAQQTLRRIESGDKDALAELTALVRGSCTERLRVNREKLIDTKSNLRFQVFESIMNSLSFPLGIFVLKKNLIDKQLCDSRNEIAHGRASFPRAEETLELHKKVVEMMDEMRDLSIAQVRKKGYRAATDAS